MFGVRVDVLAQKPQNIVEELVIYVCLRTVNHVVSPCAQMEKKRQKEVEMQRLEQIREEFKKKTEGLLQFKGQYGEYCVAIATLKVCMWLPWCIVTVWVVVCSGRREAERSSFKGSSCQW